MSSVRQDPDETVCNINKMIEDGKRKAKEKAKEIPSGTPILDRLKAICTNILIDAKFN